MKTKNLFTLVVAVMIAATVAVLVQAGNTDINLFKSTEKKQTSKDFKPAPARGFFVVFRFYGPLEGYIEKTWILNDFELVK